MLNIIKSLNANMRGISLISNNIANSIIQHLKKVIVIFRIFILIQLQILLEFSGMGVVMTSQENKCFKDL